MDTKRICTLCGKALPASAPEGLCPECLLKAGIGSGVDIGTEPGANRTGFVPPAVAELAPLFPQLEILELIGKGGMGAVYRARQTQLNRLVALKILPPDVGHESAFAARFTREAQALASLNHPGIVTLYEFGQVARARTPLPAAGPQIDDAHPLPRPGSAGGSATQLSTVNPQTPLYFFLMEFVDGVNLRQLMHTGRVSAHAALAIVPQICDALQFAHDQGIVHRDIKPENVLLDRRGRVKVADFGLAKIVGGNQPLIPSLSPSDPSNGERVAKPGEASPAFTDAGKVMGTPNYMSPEQIEAPGEVDHRADIYALGVVFYQMLTGELPGKRIEPASVKVHIDVRLDEVVLRALEKNPELRYQQASVFKTQVETIATTPPGAGGRQSAQTETAAGQSGQSLIEAAAPQKARLRWRTFGALRLHMMGHAPGKRRALWTWICSASSAALLFTLIMMAFHVRVALGRWPAFGEDYSTVLFRAHVYLLLGAWWFALVIATPLWILFLFLRPFRLGWRAHAAQAGLFGLGWLLIFIAAKYDPTPFTSWLLD